MSSDMLPSRLALAGALLMLCLVSVSAYLRLAPAGLGCQPWPDCYARAFHSGLPDEPQHHPVARLTHRVLASAIGVVVLLIVFASFVRRSQRPAQFWVSLASLALTGGLAALGRTPSGISNPVVASSNLLGGLVLLALLTWIGFDAAGAGRNPERGQRNVRLLAYTTVALIAIQLALGALLSTRGAAAACPELAGCDTGSPAAALHWMHRSLALTLLLAGGALCLGLLRAGGFARALASAVIVLAVLQIGIGAAMVKSQFPLWLGLLHNFGAALLMMAAVLAARWTSRR